MSMIAFDAFCMRNQFLHSVDMTCQCVIFIIPLIFLIGLGLFLRTKRCDCVRLVHIQMHRLELDVFYVKVITAKRNGKTEIPQARFDVWWNAKHAKEIQSMHVIASIRRLYCVCPCFDNATWFYLACRHISSSKVNIVTFAALVHHVDSPTWKSPF